ncbi:MAG: F0F1 ATP synthase subunit A [Pseudonocardia sp.]|nr:F0F1 ATP synthase subunit A [Pseudonocardia sp.]
MWVLSLFANVVVAEGIEPGKHWTVERAGLTFNLDTILATLIAGSLVAGIGLWVAHRATAGRPTRIQVVLEVLVGWIQGQVRDALGRDAPAGLIGFCVTLFAFILTCNWLAALPTEHVLPATTADVNLAYAMTLVVFLWLHVWAIRRSPRRYGRHLIEPYAAMAWSEFITTHFSRPVSLALRLFGNIFAGGIMVSVIGLLPAYLLWLPNAGWKLFDMFVGAIQALIFTLLTIIYFGSYAEHEETPAT